MHNDMEQRIADERTHVTDLDSKLDSNRTPYLKGQLRRAGHHLDDALAGLRHASRSSGHTDMWLGFAEMNLQMAAQMRKQVQDLVKKFGGPERITEPGS